MGFGDTLRMMLRLHLDGGIEIRTYDPDLSGPSTGDPSPALMYTLVQPDADVINRICLSAFDRPEVCSRHLAALRSLVDNLHSLRRNLRLAWIGSRVIGGGLIAASICSPDWRSGSIWNAGGIVSGLALLFGRHIARWLFRLYFKREWKLKSAPGSGYRSSRSR